MIDLCYALKTVMKHLIFSLVLYSLTSLESAQIPICRPLNKFESDKAFSDALFYAFF